MALPYTEVRGKEYGSFRQVLSVRTATQSSSSILPKRLVYPDVPETTVFTPSEEVNNDCDEHSVQKQNGSAVGRYATLDKKRLVLANTDLFK